MNEESKAGSSEVDSDIKATPQAASAVRPLRPKYQIFISSTLEDLREERKEIAWELLKAGHIPVGMENFSAQDDRGWKAIQRAIDTTDYYVLIVAGRYGYIDPALPISWTEREYNYALSKGVPILAFLREPAAIRSDAMDPDANKVERLASFKARINNTHMREMWTDTADLRAKVTAALTKHIQDDIDNENERPGWYRGNRLPQTVTGEELARLSSENREMRQRLSAFESREPVLHLELANVKARRRYGGTHVAQSKVTVEYPNPFENTDTSRSRTWSVPGEFRKSLQRHRCQMALLSAFGFYIHNSSSISAQGVQIRIRIPKNPSVYLFDGHSLPEKPLDPQFAYASAAKPNVTQVKVSAFEDHWEVFIDFGKVQPSDERWTSEVFFIGSTVTQKIDATARIFADNLSKPTEVPLSITIELVQTTLERDAQKA